MASRAILVVIFAVLLFRGKWLVWERESDPLEGGNCSIPVESIGLSCERFVAEYLGKQPVVIRLPREETERNQKFLEQSQLDFVREHYSHLPLKISTANAYTGREWTEMTMADYLNGFHGPQKSDKHGNETLYLFGSQFGEDWDKFLSPYKAPTLLYPSESIARKSAAGLECSAEVLEKWTKEGVSLSFGIAGRGTGVPFHFHGPGFLQMLHGRKRWFLYPPNIKPQYDPNATVLKWLTEDFPSLTNPPSHDCVLEPLDIIYFPSEWVHATLNLDDYTCFVASFA